jgi:hypothetical protein
MHLHTVAQRSILDAVESDSYDPSHQAGYAYATFAVVIGGALGEGMQLKKYQDLWSRIENFPNEIESEGNLV